MRPDSDRYRTPFRLRDGREVLVRPLRPEDEPLIVAFHAGHSENTLRMRFFGLVKILTHESLIRLCHLDYDREMALAAVRRDAERRPHFLGVSRYHLDPVTQSAEYAVVVSDAAQGKGLGRHLMGRLIQVARERGIRRLFGPVLAENAAMLRLARELGFRERPTADPTVVMTELDLAG